MKPKLFYLNLEHEGCVRQAFGIKLSRSQTILSPSISLSKYIHTTLHQPQADKGLLETVSQVRESQQNQTVTLLRVPHRNSLIELVGIYINRDQLDSAKEFRKS